MSIAEPAPPPAPDDDDYSPEPTRHDRVLAELTRRTERIAREDRAIAQAQARRIEELVDLQAWSELPQVAALLHGSPESIATADRDAATLTPNQARAAAHNRWDDHEVARRTIISETACLTRVAERTIERQMDEARFLCGYAPVTFTALAAGEISYRHALVMLEQIRTLPLEDQAAFEESILPQARSLAVGRFRDRARRLREKLHPESIEVRTRDAFAERRTYWEPAQDGMGWLHWYGTARDTIAAYDRINVLARPNTGTRAAAGAGTGTDAVTDTATDPAAAARSLDQLRADITSALLLDGITPTGMGAGIRGKVMVTVPVLTLLGRSDEPGTLEGYGPISPEAAREIAADAPSFTRLLIHPETGILLSVGTRQHRVTKAMRKVIRHRDETCRFPGCSRPARTSDIDHTLDWQYGGPTDHDNLAHLCEPHHRLKHLSQWSVTQERGGVLRWTSPGRRSYLTDPANPIAPPTPAPPAPTPLKRRRSRRADLTGLPPRRQPRRGPTPAAPENPPF